MTMIAEPRKAGEFSLFRFASPSVLPNNAVLSQLTRLSDGDPLARRAITPDSVMRETGKPGKPTRDVKFLLSS